MTSTIVEVDDWRYGARCDGHGAGLQFGGRHAAGRHPAPPGRRTAAADAAQQRHAVVRRAAVGGQGAGGTRRVRRCCCARAASRCCCSADLLTEALANSGAARMHGISAAVDSRRLGLPSGPRTLGVPAHAGSRRAGARADGGHDVQRAAVRRERTVAGAAHAPRRRLRHRSAAEPAVHPRLVVLDRSAGGDHVAGAARPDARDVADRPDLRPPPAVPRASGGPTSRGRRPSRAATCCCSRRVWWPSGWGSAPRRPGAEALARSLFDDDLAHTVLAVPIAQERAQMHLDTVCTMVDADAVVMYPNIVDSLSAFTIRRTSMAG